MALLFVFVLTVNYNIVEMSFHLDAVLLSQSQKRVRRDRNFRLDDVLLQHIQDLLPRNSLELTISLRGRTLLYIPPQKPFKVVAVGLGRVGEGRSVGGTVNDP